MYNLDRKNGSDTGRTFESRLFGTANYDPQFLLDLTDLPRDERGRYKNSNAVYDLFKKHYLGVTGGGASAERGETSMTTDLRLAVLDAPGFDVDDAALRFYSALGTEIDHKFGVDAFFEVMDPETGAWARVTVDATLNKAKQEDGYKADVIIGEFPDGGQETDAYLEKMDTVGKRIARLLKRRLDEQITRRNQRHAA